MERNLALEVVRATEAAALAAARFIGKGDEQMADRVAAEAMRNTLNSIAMDGKIVVGEGDRGATDLLKRAVGSCGEVSDEQGMWVPSISGRPTDSGVLRR